MPKIFRSKYLKGNAVTLVMLGLGGCGTQAGNPPTETHTPKLFDDSVSASLLNGMYTELIDNINLGEYAYSSGESRVTNRLLCQSQGDSGLSLKKETQTQHSVSRAFENRRSTADLEIYRQYIDTWYQDGQRLSCDPSTGKTGVDLNVGRQTLLLVSEVTENHKRQLRIEDEQGSELVSHAMQIQKSGRRLLNLAKDADDALGIRLAASLEEQQMERTIFTNDDAGEISRFTVRQIPESGRTAMNFEVNLDSETRFVKSYEIKDARMLYDLDEDQELMMQFDGVIIEPGDHCFPTQGHLTGYLRQGARIENFSVQFGEGRVAASLALKLDSGRELVFAPDACVLDER